VRIAAGFGYCDYSATKESHRELRNKFKRVVIAGQYGQSATGLADTLGISVLQAETYQRREAALYPKYRALLTKNRVLENTEVRLNQKLDQEWPALTEGIAKQVRKLLAIPRGCGLDTHPTCDFGPIQIGIAQIR